MNNEEMLENVVNQLISQDSTKWTKKYRKYDDVVFREYSTKIGSTSVEIYSVNYLRKSIISRLYSLLCGELSYHIAIDNGDNRKSFQSRNKKGKLSKLYHRIEKEVGKITDEEETDLLLGLSKQLNSPRLRIVK